MSCTTTRREEITDRLKLYTLSAQDYNNYIINTAFHPKCTESEVKWKIDNLQINLGNTITIILNHKLLFF